MEPRLSQVRRGPGEVSTARRLERRQVGDEEGAALAMRALLSKSLPGGGGRRGGHAAKSGGRLLRLTACKAGVPGPEWSQRGRRDQQSRMTRRQGEAEASGCGAKQCSAVLCRRGVDHGSTLVPAVKRWRWSERAADGEQKTRQARTLGSAAEGGEELALALTHSRGRAGGCCFGRPSCCYARLDP